MWCRSTPQAPTYRCRGFVESQSNGPCSRGGLSFICAINSSPQDSQTTIDPPVSSGASVYVSPNSIVR